MERFACSTLVVSGPDALTALRQPPCGRLLVVTEPEWVRSGEPDRIRQAAGQPAMTVFEGFGAVPSMQQAVEGSSRIREFGPELVVALGHEGTLDLAKAMVCFSKQGCRLALIPAGPAAGTEITGRVTLTHNGRRHLLCNDAMRPALTVLDPGTTGQLLRSEVAEGGFALLAAALECYAGSGNGLLSDLHAREAFVSAWAALPAAFGGSAAARKKIQTASLLTGLALEEQGQGLCRAMENSLGEVFGLSRGRAAAIVLPVVVGCNAHAAGHRYAALCRAAGLGGSRVDIAIRNLRTGLCRLRGELGLPGTLLQAGVELRSVWNSSRRLLELTLEDPACRNNPVAVDDFLVRRILEQITGRI